MKKICAICKKEFIKIGRNQKYCSKECFKQSYQHFCIDCKKELFGHNIKTLRCASCAKKGDLNPIHKIDRNGINNPMYGKIGCWLGKRRPDISERMLGNKNINYIDGTSGLYPPEFNDYLKNNIRKRDKYICQNCGMTEEEHLIVIGKVLEIHHINYNKNNCSEDNLITVCSYCNTRANYNRDYWQEFYTNKIRIIIENIKNEIIIEN